MVVVVAEERRGRARGEDVTEHAQRECSRHGRILDIGGSRSGIRCTKGKGRQRIAQETRDALIAGRVRGRVL